MSRRKEKWPKTVEEAVARILSSLSEEDKKAIRNTPKEDLVMFHFGLGLYIRNAFGLWLGNEELLKSCEAIHPDDASMVIIEAIWERLQKD